MFFLIPPLLTQHHSVFCNLPPFRKIGDNLLKKTPLKLIDSARKSSLPT